MPLKYKTVEESRKEFVEATKTSKNFSLLCGELGIIKSKLPFLIFYSPELPLHVPIYFIILPGLYFKTRL